MIKHLESEQRKKQIIEAALLLFQKKGYEDTSIQDILQAAGLSKGGFYHHFKSKKDLLEVIAQSFIREILAITQAVASRKDLTALQKLNAYFEKVNDYKKKNLIEVMTFLHELYRDDKNIRLEWLVFQYTQQQLLPIMRDIIRQGTQEGTFHSPFPEECADLLTKMFLIHQKEMGELFIEAMREDGQEKLKIMIRKYDFMQQTIESMLGIPAGSLNLTRVADSTIQYFKQAIQLSDSHQSP